MKNNSANYLLQSISAWNIFVTVLPIIIGFVFYFLDHESLPDAPTRVLIGLVAGISLQFKGIDASFNSLKSEVENRQKMLMLDVQEELAENRKEVISEISLALQMSFSAMNNGSATSNSLRKIVNKSGEFGNDLDHLTPELIVLTQRWSAEYFGRVEKAVSRLADNNTVFDGGAGMDADRLMVKNATSTILGTTIVNQNSINFWTNSVEGETYRSHIYDFTQRNPELKVSEKDNRFLGSGRLFVIEKTLLDSFYNEDMAAVSLVKKALIEALEQSRHGVSIKILDEPEMVDVETANLDMLIVDNAMSSRTVSLDDRGVARRVIISWRENDIQNQLVDWKRLWNRGVDIEEFCKQHGIDSSLLT